MKTKMMRHDIRDERGASLFEYSILVALIAVVSIAAVQNVGYGLAQRYDRIERKVGPGTGGICDPEIEFCPPG